MSHQELVAVSGIDPTAIRKAAFMLPVPTADQIKGLSFADLAICLMRHSGAIGKPCFYRDRLWWEWYNVEGLTQPEATNRWLALPHRTKEWIAPDSRSAKVGPRHVYVAIHRLNRILRLTDRDDSIGRKLRRAGVIGATAGANTLCSALGMAKSTFHRRFHQVRPAVRGADRAALLFETANVRRDLYLHPYGRGDAKYWRNLLFWNWHHADLFRSYGGHVDLWLFWLSLPSEARNVIDAADALPSHADPTRLKHGDVGTFSHAAAWCDKHLNPAQRERYLGTPPSAAIASSSGVVTRDPFQRRRAAWLSLYEATGKELDVLLTWDGWTDEKRFAESGPRASRKLCDGHRTRSEARAIIRLEVRRAMWERQIDKKPPGYGQKLFFLVDSQRGLTPSESAKHWDGIGDSRRRQFDPGKATPLCDRRIKARPSQVVTAALRTIRGDQDAASFAKKYAPMIGKFPAPALREKTAGNRTAAVPDWYGKIAALALEKGIKGSALLNYVWDLPAERRREFVPESMWPSFSRRSGRRARSARRMRFVVSMGKRLIQATPRDSISREMPASEPGAAIGTSGRKDGPPVEKKRHGGRHRGRQSSTMAAIAAFQQGLKPGAVAERFAISAANARQIQTRARNDGLLPKRDRNLGR